MQPQQPYQNQFFIQNQYDCIYSPFRAVAQPIFIPTTISQITFINNNPNVYVPVPSPQEPILKDPNEACEFKYLSKSTLPLPNPLYTSTNTQNEPITGRYSGYFYIRNNGLEKIIEAHLHITFTLSPSQPGIYLVEGYGTNRFGYFVLNGNFSVRTYDLICVKKYTVKPSKNPSISSMNNIKSLMYNSKKTNGPRPLPKEIIYNETDNNNNNDNNQQNQQQKQILQQQQQQAQLQSQQQQQQQQLIDKTIIPLSSNPLASYYPLLETLLKDTFSTPFLFTSDPKMNINSNVNNNPRPLDLTTIKYKFHHGKYNTSDEFANDIRAIFKSVCCTPHIHQAIYLMADTLLKEFEKSYSRIKASEQSLLLAQKRAAEEQTLPSPLSTNSTTSSTRTSRSRLSKKRKLNNNNNNNSNIDNINENDIIYYNPTPSDDEIIASNDIMDMSTNRLTALDCLMSKSFPNKKDITDQEYENIKNGLKNLTRPEDRSLAYQFLIEDPYYEDKRNDPNIKFELRNLDITTLLELHEFLKTVSLRNINVQQMRKKTASV